MNALKNELAGVPARFFSITYEPPAKVREFLAKHAIDTEVGIDDDLATFGSLPDAPQHPGWDDPAGAAKYFRAQLEEDRAKYGRN
jgi:hypothetical protein